MTRELTRHGCSNRRRRRRLDPRHGAKALGGSVAACLIAALVMLASAAGPASAQAPSAPPATTTERQDEAPPPAQESEPIPEGGGSSVVSAGSDGTMVRLFVGLVVVVGLVIGIWLILKRVQRSRFPAAAAPGGAIEVIATTPLGPNRALHLVRVGGQRFLVGVTEHAVSPLTRVEDDDDVHDLMAQTGKLSGIDISSLDFDDGRQRAGATATRTASAGPGWSDSTSSGSFIDRLRSATARRPR